MIILTILNFNESSHEKAMHDFLPPGYGDSEYQLHEEVCKSVYGIILPTPVPDFIEDAARRELVVYGHFKDGSLTKITRNQDSWELS